ncbi:MAG: 3-oxocholest-4-en-26-oyl-CoA dehydrogenase alpha subunit, partial [Actinomycetota bacterium]
MHLEETADQRALRDELRAYFAQLLPPEVRAELAADAEGGPVFRRLVKQMGTDGWLGIGWPEEFGGQGRPATDQFVFFDEVQRAAAPFPFVTLNTVGPTLMSFGSDEQKKEFLPAIVAGEVN